MFSVLVLLLLSISQLAVSSNSQVGALLCSCYLISAVCTKCQNWFSPDRLQQAVGVGRIDANFMMNFIASSILHFIVTPAI